MSADVADQNSGLRKIVLVLLALGAVSIVSLIVAGATSLITTGKDAVKLRSLSFSLPYSVFEIEIVLRDEELFRNLVLNAAAVA